MSPATRGILLMIAAMLTFSAGDAIARGLTERLPALQIVWMRYVGQTAVVLLLLAPQLRSRMQSDRLWLQVLRATFLVVATTFLIFGFGTVGLAQSTATLMINPLLITLGAMLFLSEPVGPRRIIGAVVGMLGAFLIIRPGSVDFTPAALLPLAAALCYVGYMLLTRVIARGVDDVWTSLIYTTTVGALLLSVLMPFVWMPMAPQDWWLMVGMGLLGSVGQFMIIRALTVTDASVVAPFAYVNLMGAAAFGTLVFGERIDLYTALGSAIIVGSGLYVWHRERAARAATRG
ncbi:MAG: DMT family transporter [Rhodobacteraceae bacterium]|nr:DMT family transporter [Paracoccaceae bacterium]